MVGVYVRLINAGLRKQEDVPSIFYEAVKAELEKQKGGALHAEPSSDERG